MFCHRWEAFGGDRVMGGWVFPQSLRVSHSANGGRPRHVIRGVKLEFSSEAGSPSADFFLFRPPEKQVFSIHLWLGRTFTHCQHPEDSSADVGGETWNSCNGTLVAPRCWHQHIYTLEHFPKRGALLKSPSPWH